MYYIKDAQFRRVTEYNGLNCAEVQVTSGGVEDPDLLVYFAHSAHGDELDIVRMIANDAEAEVDWYDNNMHQAFVEISEDQFGDRGYPAPPQQRAEFKRDLLSKEGLLSKINQELSK